MANRQHSIWIEGAPGDEYLIEPRSGMQGQRGASSRFGVLRPTRAQQQAAKAADIDMEHRYRGRMGSGWPPHLVSMGTPPVIGRTYPVSPSTPQENELLRWANRFANQRNTFMVAWRSPKGAFIGFTPWSPNVVRGHLGHASIEGYGYLHKTPAYAIVPPEGPVDWMLSEPRSGSTGYRGARHSFGAQPVPEPSTEKWEALGAVALAALGALALLGS